MAGTAYTAFRPPQSKALYAQGNLGASWQSVRIKITHRKIVLVVEAEEKLDALSAKGMAGHLIVAIVSLSQEVSRGVSCLV